MIRGNLRPVGYEYSFMTLWSNAARIFGQLCRTLAEHGEVTVRVADLQGDGLTKFKGKLIYLDRDLTVAGIRVALCHELIHLRSGPVAPALAVVEESRVRAETARTLATASSTPRRRWTTREKAAVARRRGSARSIPLTRAAAEDAA